MKPHFWMAGGLWHCGVKNRKNIFTGVGVTPAEAHEDRMARILSSPRFAGAMGIKVGKP